MLIKDMIKFYRKQIGYTQQQLANKVGVSQDTVSLWEKGTQTPTYDVTKKLCVIFDISGDEILGLETEEDRKAIKINNSFNNNNGQQNINIS